MWWLLSYVGANWSLILVTILVVVALVALAWFARNWKLAVAAVLILAAGFAYQQIDHNAYARAQAEEARRDMERKQAEIKTLEERIAVINSANEVHAANALADQARIDELQEKANATPADATVALKRDAVRRVREFRRAATGAAPGQGATAASPGGHPKVLPIWKWRRPAAGS